MTEVEKCELKFDMDLVFAALPETHRRAALLFMRGYTQKEVAKELGVHKNTICNWMKQFRAFYREFCD